MKFARNVINMHLFIMQNSANWVKKRQARSLEYTVCVCVCADDDEYTSGEREHNRNMDDSLKPHTP